MISKGNAEQTETSRSGAKNKNNKNDNIHRMMIFESGLVYAAAVNGDSVLLEPHCLTFTYVLRNGTFTQHVSKYSPRQTHYLLKNAILFKNTHIALSNKNNSTEEDFVPFFCPDIFTLLNIPFRTTYIDSAGSDEKSNTSNENPIIDRIHWPKYMTYKQYCTINNDDESTTILSTDGFSKLSLSPHEQIVHVSYPFVIPDSTESIPLLPGNYKNKQPTTKIYHIHVNHIFPTDICPKMFQHPYNIAKDLSDSTLSEGKDDHEEDEDNIGRLKPLHVVDVLLPKATNINDDEYKLNLLDWHDVRRCVSPLGLSWKEECVELGKNVMPLNVPTIERVLVEWTSDHTIWLSENKPKARKQQQEEEEDSINRRFPTVEYGVLLHSNNAFLKVIYQKGFHNSDNGHIHEYLMHTNAFFNTYTCLACKDEHKDAIRYVQRLHRHHEACMTLQIDSFIGKKEKKMTTGTETNKNENSKNVIDKLKYEDLANVPLPIHDIAIKMKLRDQEKEHLLQKIERYRMKQPDIDMVLQQTRRFIERQKLEEPR